MPTDIYSSKIVKKLRRQKNGDTLALIYMELAIEALKRNGVLRYDGVEPTIEEELALLLDEKVEDIRTLLLLLVACRAAKMDGKNIVLTAVETLPADISLAHMEKREYGKYKNVLLSDEDVKRLEEEFPDYRERIEELSSYIASVGDKYKNHFATLQNWAKRQSQKDTKTAAKPNSFNDYEQREYDPEELKKLVNNNNN